jgi:hypothetical protein
VAVQVVSVGRGPASGPVAAGLVLRASNTARARTTTCRRCSALALAYQFVVVTPGRPALTPAARGRLDALRQRLHVLVRSTRSRTGPDDASVVAAADRIALDLAEALRHGVVVTGAAGPMTAGAATGSSSGSSSGSGPSVRTERSLDGTDL